MSTDEIRAGHERLLLLLLLLLFAAASMAAPINHDESQYVGAIAMMRQGLPFRDWPFLQTPLQPLLLSPLSIVPAGWLLVAARLANVLFGILTCWALLRLLRDRVPFWAAAAAAIGMATTNAFLFGTEVARNDMLPAALLALSLVAFLPGDRAIPGWRRTALAGLCLGLAISAKISMAVPAAGAGLWLLWRARLVGGKAILAAMAGGVLGLLPSIVLFGLAPERFTFGVFTYSMVAPELYWTGIGQAYRLEPLTKLANIVEETLSGATAVAFLLTLVTLRSRAPQRLLEIMAFGGVIAAYLPDPFFKQYLIPLLPPLFARAALALPALERHWRRIAIGAGAATAAVGTSGSVLAIAGVFGGHVPLVEAVQRGRMVAEAARDLPVVTLSPEQIAGADVQLRPGFTAGPFLYRIQGGTGKMAQTLTGAPNYHDLEALDRDPPALIVTGAERRRHPPLFPEGLDRSLDQWAAERGYRPLPLPGHGWQMWLAPTKRGGPGEPPHLGELKARPVPGRKPV